MCHMRGERKPPEYILAWTISSLYNSENIEGNPWNKVPIAKNVCCFQSQAAIQVLLPARRRKKDTGRVAEDYVVPCD
jgi:hypothetical protein